MRHRAPYLVLMLGVAVAIGMTVRVNQNAIGRQHRSDCRSANTFRRLDAERWKFIVGLAPPPHDSESRDRLDRFEKYIARADRLASC